MNASYPAPSSALREGQGRVLSGEASATGAALEMIRSWYHPAPSIRVGVLLLGDALAGREQPVDDALKAAGHAPRRRKCRLQPRPGEQRARAEDVLEFAERFGHEYALAVVASWPEMTGHERDLVAVLHDAGCAVLWQATGDGECSAIPPWGVDGVIPGLNDGETS